MGFEPIEQRLFRSQQPKVASATECFNPFCEAPKKHHDHYQHFLDLKTELEDKYCTISVNL